MVNEAKSDFAHVMSSFGTIPVSSLFSLFISSPEPKAHGELIVYQSSRRLSVCLCVYIFKHEYL